MTPTPSLQAPVPSLSPASSSKAQSPSPSPLPVCVWRLCLAGEAETVRLAGIVAGVVGAGDLLTLSGELGVGKTTFARALIRHLTCDPELEVPSPTFTLIQAYNGAAFPVVHADLYRLRHASEMAELGLEEAAEGALVLMEWAERADNLATERLDITFHLDAAEGVDRRDAVLTGNGRFAARLERARAIHELLQRCGWDDARRTFMLGDASSRAYERLAKAGGETAILMISPPRPDGPVLRNSKSYSGIARLAENIDAFLAVGAGLRSYGFSAPNVLAADRKVGLAVLEDFGAEPFVSDGEPLAERYAEAVALLARLHGLTLPTALPLENDTYQIPPFDLDALIVEVDLLLDWYAPQIAQITLAASTRATFSSLWKGVLRGLPAQQRTWVLRDFHSPNLIWLAERQGIDRVGVLDFQDCVLGHPAYDLASLLQDARVSVSDALELRLLAQYAQARTRAQPQFDPAEFLRAYAIVAAQRATKILGIFARLDRRDGKPQYLAHVPRLERYLLKNLGHPALLDIKRWYEKHLPRALAQSA